MTIKLQRDSGRRLEFWTPTLDEWLTEIWGSKPISVIAREMKVGQDRIRRRAIHLGLPLSKPAERYEPTKELWISIASEEAVQAGISAGLVLAGSNTAKACVARWKAWRRILDENPHLSIAGVARVSGFDWTTILHGLKRIGGATPEEMAFQEVSKASGRRPVVSAPMYPGRLGE